MTKINNEIYKNFGERWYHSKDYVALLRNESRTRNTWVIEKLKEQFVKIISEGGKAVFTGCGTSGRVAFLCAREYNIILKRVGFSEVFA